MSKTDTHVMTAIRGGWSVRKAGAERALRTFLVKGAAISYGRSIARGNNADLIIHKRDGRISDRISYGSHSGPTKGKK